MTIFPRFRLFGLGFCLLGSATSVRPAGLVWDSQSLHLTSHPGETAVHANFHFRNAGDRAIALVSIEPSCRCVDAVASKTICRPGESGDINVLWTIAGQKGRQEKSILVTTDQPQEQPEELTLQIDIPAD